MKNLETLLKQPTFAVSEALLAAKQNNPTNVIYDEAGQTLLHRMISLGKSNRNINLLEHLNAIQDLVKIGYDINILNKQSETPLQYLMNGCNSFSPPGNRAFRIYTFTKNKVYTMSSEEFNTNLIAGYFMTSDALFLVKLGATLCPDKYYQPLLHRLVCYYKSEIGKHNRDAITALVRIHNIDINSLDQQNRTPLQVLLEQNDCSLDSLVFLLGLGANPNLLSGNPEVMDNSKEPLFVRIIQVVWQSMEVLEAKKYIENLVSTYHINIHLKNPLEKSALSLLCQKKNHTLEEILSLSPLYVKEWIAKNDFKSITNLYDHYEIKNKNTFFQHLRSQAYEQLIDLVNQSSLPHKLALLKSAKKHCQLFSMHGVVGQIFRGNSDTNIISKIDALISKLEQQGYSKFFVQSKEFDEQYDEKYSLDDEPEVHAIPLKQ